MDFLYYFIFWCVGISLAVLGGGGAILTVPILFYLFSFGAQEATSYSLFLVGISALLGAYEYYKSGQIDFKVSLSFAAPSIIGVFLVRKFLMPAIAEVIDLGFLR